MAFLAIMLSLIAIAMAYVALQRTGGLQDLRQQVDHLTSKTEEIARGAREATAGILRRLEHMVRGSEAKPSEKDKNGPPL
jgi:membrane carboxypeptidase/penicillin-binding protein PbpC